MTRSIVLALCLCSGLLPLSAQQSSSTSKASSIAGTVVQEPGRQPIKKVLVQVIAEDQKHGENYTASTDADGHFQVENVAPGRYRIFTERTGFVAVNERGLKSDTNVFTIQAGQSIGDLFFRMLPTAVITGRITDEDGDPMSGISVIAQKKNPGKASRQSVASGTTNDLGEYRLSGLFPGQYWIVAMPPPDFRDYERQREKSPDDSKNDSKDTKSDTRYVTTYYSGTYDAMQASALTLKAGDEMPVNLALLPTRTYRVRGVVTGAASSLKAAVELFSKGGDTYRANANEIGPDGQFEIRGVAPGSYVLIVSTGGETKSLTARQDIKVVAADIDGVRLIPQPTFTLSGHLHLASGETGNVTQYVANLRLAETSDDGGLFVLQDVFGTNASVDRFGNVEWKDVNPAYYIVQMYGGGSQDNFFLKSVTLGGRDVAAGFAASGPLTLDIIVSTRGATVEGTVVENEKDVDNDHPVANATVVAVPEEKYRKLPDRFATGSSDQHGHFMIRGLAPGSYTLYAWQDLKDGVWHDADFLKSQEATGTAVRVEEGSDQRVMLKLSPVSEEWR